MVIDFKEKGTQIRNQEITYLWIKLASDNPGGEISIAFTKRMLDPSISDEEKLDDIHNIMWFRRELVNLFKQGR